MSRSCVFCGVSQGATVLAREGGTVAIADINPVVPGHCLIVPERHVETYLDFTDIEAGQAKVVASRLTDQMRREDSRIQGFNLLWNCGPAAWQTIPHAHMHVVPRRAGDDLLAQLVRHPALGS